MEVSSSENVDHKAIRLAEKYIDSILQACRGGLS